MKRFKTGRALLAAACAALLLLSGCGTGSTAETPAATEAPAAAAATYTASAEGKMGPVTVEVTFEDGVITDVSVTDQQETEGVADPALEQIPAAIVEQQSVAVDVVSGATYTSTAIIEAVKDCIAQAGLDVADYSAELTSESSSQELTADVLVIGAGGAGLSAAIEAASQGANVLLIEKLSTVGGSTKLSEGMVVRGVQEGENEEALTTDELYQLYVNYSWNNEYFSIDMVRDFADNIDANAQWLLDNGFDAEPYFYNGWLPLDPSDDWATNAISVIELVNGEPEGGQGYYITSALESAALSAGVTIMTDTAGTELLTDDTGAVTGAMAQGTDNTEYTIHANAVVLACGGFGGNEEMLAEYAALSQYDAIGPYVGGAGNTGDGITMAEAVGAATGMFFTDLGATSDICYTTTGGVIIDGDARVLDGNGDPIPNLYAAGEMTDVAVMGNYYTICGTYNAWSVYTGRIAGANAAAEG